MNLSGFGNDNIDRFVGNQSVEQADKYSNPSKDLWSIITMSPSAHVIMYVVYALGIPGNILSAIVWLRRHVASENPPAIYLSALAIVDLLWLICNAVYGTILRCFEHPRWFCRYLMYPSFSADLLEPLLVLSFSVVRLSAIRRPLQVRLRLSHFRHRNCC